MGFINTTNQRLYALKMAERAAIAQAEREKRAECLFSAAHPRREMSSRWSFSFASLAQARLQRLRACEACGLGSFQANRLSGPSSNFG